MRVALTMALNVLPAAGMAQVFSTTPAFFAARAISVLGRPISTPCAMRHVNVPSATPL